jgi:hypothetical protein
MIVFFMMVLSFPVFFLVFLNFLWCCSSPLVWLLINQTFLPLSIVFVMVFFLVVLSFLILFLMFVSFHWWCSSPLVRLLMNRTPPLFCVGDGLLPSVLEPPLVRLLMNWTPSLSLSLLCSWWSFLNVGPPPCAIPFLVFFILFLVDRTPLNS